MRKLVWGAVLVVVLALTAAIVWLESQPQPAVVVDPGPSAAATRDGSEAPKPAGRPPETIDPATLAAARRALADGGREDRCGPYRLWTDVDDRRLLAACVRIGETLDAVYSRRFGVEPVGTPSETIVLFAGLDGFQRFVASEGRLPRGYRGYAEPASGYLALYHEKGNRGEVIKTLAHELTHLVHRRALGFNLPPWLSEGLADAIGDAAGHDGLRPLAGIDGVEHQARRLRSAYRSGEAGSLERLTALDRSRFDRGVRSFDYEQSALAVRFLLLDPELAPRFRAWLGELAAGARYDQAKLPTALGLSWQQLDARFTGWLEPAGRR